MSDHSGLVLDLILLIRFWNGGFQWVIVCEDLWWKKKKRGKCTFLSFFIFTFKGELLSDVEELHVLVQYCTGVYDIVRKNREDTSVMVYNNMVS